MLGLFNSGNDDANKPLTDRDEIIRALKRASIGECIDFEPTFGPRRVLTVRERSGRHLIVSASSDATHRLIDTRNGTLLDDESEGTEFGIQRLWLSESMREKL